MIRRAISACSDVALEPVDEAVVLGAGGGGGGSSLIGQTVVGSLGEADRRSVDDLIEVLRHAVAGAPFELARPDRPFRVRLGDPGLQPLAVGRLATVAQWDQAERAAAELPLAVGSARTQDALDLVVVLIVAAGHGGDLHVVAQVDGAVLPHEPAA